MAEEEKKSTRKSKSVEEKATAKPVEKPEIKPEEKPQPKPVEKKKSTAPKKETLVGKEVRLFSGRIFVVKEQKSDDVFILTRKGKDKEYVMNKQDFEILD